MNGSNIKFLLFITILSTNNCLGQQSDLMKYLNQKPPTQTPEIFAPGLISKPTQSEFGSVFSKDGFEFFYAAEPEGKAEIRYTKLEDGTWTPPQTIVSHNTYGHNDPFLSPDENELYFISDRPMAGKGVKKDYDIWYVKKEANGWSVPINAGLEINSNGNEYYISFTEDGTMYYASNRDAAANRKHNFDIYSSKKVNGEFQRSVRLSDSINSSGYEADVYIALDESYIIFASSRSEGLGAGDLYISFRNDRGRWTPAKNMGEPINSVNHELCPFVTQDGKYLFFTSNQDIYWVDAAVIENYR